MIFTAARANRTAMMDVSLAALAFASGATDVTTFLTLRDVFTSAMTGNTALLGIALSYGDFRGASHSFSALVGFALGVAAGTAISVRGRAGGRADAAPLRILLVIGAACLAAFAAILTATGPSPAATVVYGLIVLSAFGMGLQGVAARHINAPGINTIVFTTTCVTIVSSLTDMLLRRAGRRKVDADTKRQIAMFFAYGCGALLAGLMLGPAFFAVVWIPLAAVLVSLACSEAAARG